MGRNKSNRVFGKQARISDWLYGEIAALIKSQQQAHAGHSDSIKISDTAKVGEVLERAWKIAYPHGAVSSEDSGVDGSITSESGQTTSLYQIKAHGQPPEEHANLVATEWESPWVRRLLTVLRSKNQKATDAIQNVLEALDPNPGAADVDSGNPPTPNLRPETQELVERAESTHELTKKALNRPKRPGAGDKDDRERA